MSTNFNELIQKRVNNAGKKVLVTGAAGYLASSIIHQLLREGYDVVGLDNNFKGTTDTLIPFIPHKHFSFILGDITDAGVVQRAYDGVDYCVHAAAIVGAPACKKYKTLASIVNVGGCENMAKYKPEHVKLVYCNTGSIYAGGHGVCNESSLVDPQSHYAKTKWEGEQAFGFTENVIAHRYATAMGLSRNNMRVNLLANDLAYQAVVNRTLTIFEADFMRTFIHCNDIADAVVFTIQHFDDMYDKQGVYNVGNNDLNFTKRQLVEAIRAKTGCHVSYAETEKDPDQRDYGYSSDAIYSFGWRPKVGLRETIDELIKAVPILIPWERYR